MKPECFESDTDCDWWFLGYCQRSDNQHRAGMYEGRRKAPNIEHVLIVNNADYH